MKNKHKKHTSHSTDSSKKLENRAYASTHGDLNKHPSMLSADPDTPNGAGKQPESSSTLNSTCPISILFPGLISLAEETKRRRKSAEALRRHIVWLGASILFMQLLSLIGISYAFAR